MTTKMQRAGLLLLALLIPMRIECYQRFGYALAFRNPASDSELFADMFCFLVFGAAVVLLTLGSKRQD